MVKTEISFRDMLGKKQYSHYRSIFYLTEIFQDKKDLTSGLEQRHYRYALQKNYKGKNEQNELKLFFEDEAGVDQLEKWYNSGIIVKDCLKPDKINKNKKIIRNNTISNILSNMVKKEFLYIVNPKEKNHIYRVPLTAFNKDHKDQMQKYIEKISENIIINLIEFEKDPYFVGYLFGFPTYFEKYIDKKDIKKIEENVKLIHDSLVDLNKICLKYCSKGSTVSIFASVTSQHELGDLIELLTKNFIK